MHACMEGIHVIYHKHYHVTSVCGCTYVVEACTVTVTYTDTLITHREVSTPPLSLLMPDHAHLTSSFCSTAMLQSCVRWLQWRNNEQCSCVCGGSGGGSVGSPVGDPLQLEDLTELFAWPIAVLFRHPLCQQCLYLQAGNFKVIWVKWYFETL